MTARISFQHYEARRAAGEAAMLSALRQADTALRTGQDLKAQILLRCAESDALRIGAFVQADRIRDALTIIDRNLPCPYHPGCSCSSTGKECAA